MAIQRQMWLCISWGRDREGMGIQNRTRGYMLRQEHQFDKQVGGNALHRGKTAAVRSTWVVATPVSTIGAIHTVLHSHGWAR